MTVPGPVPVRGAGGAGAIAASRSACRAASRAARAACPRMHRWSTVAG